jgi:hypothetical protein
VKAKAFLAAYAQTGNLTQAAAIAKCGKRQHYRWMMDPDYEAEFEEAHKEACDHLEQEARRRAVEGVDEPAPG